MCIRDSAWVVRRVPAGDGYRRMAAMVAEAGLHTVCREARCPNIHECFNRGCVTFMILGDVCTRDCRFCGVAGGSPAPVDGDEPLAWGLGEVEDRDLSDEQVVIVLRAEGEFQRSIGAVGSALGDDPVGDE